MAAAPPDTASDHCPGLPVLYGRDRELAELDHIRESARDGHGHALVVWGDPGIGKSTLLQAAEAGADGFLLLTCHGSASESVLAFAGLRELLRPVEDRIAGLPQPQARALRGALGLQPPAAADRFLLGVAVLTLLSDLAAEQPVLVVADDTQWLDAPSAQCLYFVARRCADEPLLMLLTAHTDPAGGPADQLPAMRLGGLDDAAAERLLRAEHPGIDAERIAFVQRMTLGNPLGLQELATDYVVEPGPSEAGLLGLPTCAHRAVGVRVTALPDVARRLLLVIAAEEGGDAQAIRRAAAALELPESAWDAVRDADLIRSTPGRIVMRHALIRAVVYELAAESDRIAVHRALAEVLRGADADRWAWHMAGATPGPDETVAAMLEDTAMRAWSRGGPLPAASALRQAAGLSPEPDAAGRRLALAARAAWEGGDVAGARTNLAEATAQAGSTVVVRASGGLAARIEFSYGEAAHARAELLAAAELADAETAVELRYLAQRAAWEAGVPGLEEELMALPDDGDPRPWRVPSATIALAMGRVQPVAEVLRRKLDELRTRGDAGWLSSMLAHSSITALALGHWDDAAADATEGLRISEDLGSIPASSGLSLNTLAWLAAARGHETVSIALGERSRRLAQVRNSRLQIGYVQWHLGFNALTAGRTEDALRYLADTIAPAGPAYHPTVAVLAAFDGVEAAVRLGRVEEANAHLAVLSEWAERTGAPWAIAARSGARALLTTEGAESLFRHALETPVAPERPFQHARLQLLYGEWLRRSRRRADARIELSAARTTFQRLGATPWLRRAEGELALAGDRRPATPAAAGDDLLTPQELRIARLAASGLTNRDIAAQLFISPRTVGHHLSQIFPKLGLASREDLSAIDFDHGLRMTG